MIGSRGLRIIFKYGRAESPHMTTKRFEKAYFEGGKGTVYKDYANDPWVRTNYEIIYTLIKRFNKHGTLLEIGFGYGFFLAMAEREFSTYGIEISQYGCRKAKKLLKKTRIYNGEATRLMDTLPLFDVILGHNVFPNMDHPEKCIRKCYAHLKDEGIFVMRVPNMSSIRSRLSKNRFYAFKDHTNTALYTKAQWKKMLENIGFECRVYTYVPSGFLKRVLRHTPFAVMPSIFHHLNLTQTIVFVCKKRLKNT